MLYTCSTCCCLILAFQPEIAKLITLEQGKTLIDAEGDVMRGLRKSVDFYPVSGQIQRMTN